MSLEWSFSTGTEFFETEYPLILCLQICGGRGAEWVRFQLPIQSQQTDPCYVSVMSRSPAHSLSLPTLRNRLGIWGKCEAHIPGHFRTLTRFAWRPACIHSWPNFGGAEELQEVLIVVDKKTILRWDDKKEQMLVAVWETDPITDLKSLMNHAPTT